MEPSLVFQIQGLTPSILRGSNGVFPQGEPLLWRFDDNDAVDAPIKQAVGCRLNTSLQKTMPPILSHNVSFGHLPSLTLQMDPFLAAGRRARRWGASLLF